MMKWIRFLLSCLLGGLCVLMVPATVIIVGELTHEQEAAAGQLYSGTIVIENVETQAREVKTYQTDYQFFADGRILYSEPGQAARSNANWINLTPKSFTIPPGEQVTVYYTVQVPDDQTLTGTYWSIVMVEGLAQGSLESGAAEPETGMGVQQVFRYGIQMVTHIGATGTRSLQFSGARLVKGEQKLLLDVENNGQRWLRAQLWTELYSSKGVLQGKYEAGKLRIYPGTSVRFTVDLAYVEPGKYKALVVVDCGNNDVFGANWNLVLE